MSNPSATRRRLPNRRFAETLRFKNDGHSYVATIGRNTEGAIAEVFVGCAKPDSGIDAWAGDLGILISVARHVGARSPGVAGGGARAGVADAGVCMSRNRERLTWRQIEVLKMLAKRGGARAISLPRGLEIVATSLWRRELIEVWYRQAPGEQ